MKKVLLIVMLVVFLVSLAGMSAQAKTWKTKEVEIEDYELTVIVEHPIFEEIKEFSVGESFRIDLTLIFRPTWSLGSFEQFCKHKMAFTIQAFQKKNWPTLEELKQISMFHPTRVEVYKDGRWIKQIRVKGYIEIVVDQEKVYHIVQATRGFSPLRLLIWREKHGREYPFVTTIELD